MEQFLRTEMLFGKDCTEKLKNKRVIIFGVGGVGGYACESLARSGVGTIDLVDKDVVSMSNINRQIIALHSTVGKYKTEVMKQRLLDINPNICINTYNTFYLPENEDEFDFTKYDYIVDAIDTVSGKISLAIKAQEAGTPIISSMGAGNKINPLAFEVADVYKTSVCPLARAMRAQLKKRGVKSLKVVYSKEEPVSETVEDDEGRRVFGSCSYIPAIAGLILSSEVIRDLLK